MVLPRRTVEVDILFREAMVAVELKGGAFHNDAVSVEADRLRENELQIVGNLIVQISWADVVRRPRETLAHITEALMARQVAA